jgi:hypothetical protein
MIIRTSLWLVVLFAFLACDDANTSSNNTNNANNVNNVNNFNNIPGCDSDLDCANTEYCNPCAKGSCDGCNDCVAGCVPHGCPTEAEPACNAMRPECGESGVAVVTGLCWECVDLQTCAPWRDDSCDDGTEALCDYDAEPVCEEGEILSIQDDCWRCVNPATCLPWGVAECFKDDQCAADEFCDPWGSAACPICAQAIPACSPNPCDTGVMLACYAIRPDCGPGNAAVVAADGCWQCQELETCTEVLTDEHCDDGTEITCLTFAEVVCAEHELKAIQAGCAVCVDPATCNPWGANECTGDYGCGVFERCNDCASSSCPACADCVSACVPHGCPSELEPACNMIRPDCGPDAVSVSLDGCWVCVTPGTCDPVSL